MIYLKRKNGVARFFKVLLKEEKEEREKKVTANEQESK